MAERELFGPLGIEGANWLRDPEGVAAGSWVADDHFFAGGWAGSRSW